MDPYVVPVFITDTEKQFNDNFSFFVEEAFGIEKYDSPNLTTLKYTMLNADFVKFYYPNAYRFIGDYFSGIENKFCGYIFIGLSMSSKLKQVLVIKITENGSVYYGSAITNNDGFKWFYTDDVFEVMENACKNP